MRELAPWIHQNAIPDHLRQDGAPTLKDTRETLRQLGTDPELIELVSRAAVDMHTENVRQLGRLGAVPGFDPLAIAGTDRSALRAFRERNVGLITTIGHEYLADIVKTLETTDVANLHVGGVAKVLEERFGVSKSRAEFWAVDQSLKLNAQINRERFEAAGISQYVWTTSNDERVRETHRDLDGQIYSFDDPPSIDGRPLNPGEDYLCRCTPYPYFGDNQAEDVPQSPEDYGEEVSYDDDEPPRPEPEFPGVEKDDEPVEVLPAQPGDAPDQIPEAPGLAQQILDVVRGLAGDDEVAAEAAGGGLEGEEAALLAAREGLSLEEAAEEVDDLSTSSIRATIAPRAIGPTLRRR